MTTEIAVSKKALWAGRILGALPVLMLLFSAAMKLAMPPDVAKGVEHLGWPPDIAFGLGIVELACAVVYAIPRTAVLGAILVAAYLGGATATHVRIGEPFVVPVALGVMAWAGLWFRDPRVRALLPFRGGAAA